ncbi:trifunctional serine/threonine-protein kinase/ATP-binding protein/sensor histidine kinase, partial [Aetokthonos hydrillicola]
VLKLLDIHFPEQPSLSDIQTALDEVSNSLSETSIENLIDLPCMIDPHKLAAIRILVSVAPSVKQSVPTLLPLIAQKMIFLSLQNGNAAESAFAYTLYGSVLCITSGNIDTGYQFAQLGLNLLQRFTTKEFHSRTYVVANFLVVHWKDHLRKTLHPLLEAYQSGLETGDLEHAAWSVTFYCSHAYFVGHSLPELESEIASYSEVIRQSKQQSVLNTFSVFEQVVLTWLGKRPVLHSLNDNNDYLEDLLQLVLKTNNRYALAAIHINQLILFYGFGDYKQASIHASVAREYLIAVAGSILFNIFHVYEALTDLAIYSNVDPKQQSQLLEKVKVNQATLKQWTDFAPENNLHRFNLVEAELHRVLGLKAEALQSYERAIAIAKANGYIQDEALSNELAAKFYLDWGKEKIAAGYMQEAYYCYTRWGAKAKIIDLEQQYPQLLAGILQAPTLPITYEGTVAPTLMRSFSNVSSSQNLWLDFPAVMKAAQAISQEMELEKLLATLIQMVITSAGAQIGRLLLCQDGQWLVVAQADSKQTQRLEILLEQCREIPQRVIYAVARTQQTTVFENLSDSAEFAGDHYIITHQPKSVLCTPISHQGKLISILYLENNLTVGAFTSDHLQIIQLLTAQAAISLENAQLYCQLEEYSHSLEQKVSERTQELTQKATQLESALQELKHTQAQLVQAEKMSSLGQLVAGIAHEINNPINFIYANIEPANEYVKSLIELNDLYQKYYPQPVPEIQEKIIDMEVDFLVDDLQNLLESMKIGAKRIQKIVLSLRNFSRLDEAEIKAVDLHEGMDSTLLILQHRLKNSSKNTEIGIIKSYSKIPLVNCYPSALNQVFMNILSNAIDALHQVEINHEPTITIRTEVQEEKYVVIRIIDNGIGMTESVQNKIFEPFFTTKPVGSGTGLGLSISYSIIAEQHGGQLSCISTPGKGTEFVIQIPL